MIYLRDVLLFLNFLKGADDMDISFERCKRDDMKIFALWLLSDSVGKHILSRIRKSIIFNPSKMTITVCTRCFATGE